MNPLPSATALDLEVGKIRRNLMRALYLLTFIGLGPNVWTDIFTHSAPWDPLHGVAVSFWCALTFFALVGVLYPVRLLPLLLLQLSYKAIWLLGVGLPLSRAGDLDPVASGLVMANGVGVVLDTLVIPWGYVVRKWFVKPAF